MANLGEIAELVNSRRVRLDVGADTYITLQHLHMHIAKVEKIVRMTDTRTDYQMGKEDNWFTATFLATTPEMESFNSLVEHDAMGEPTNTNFDLVYTDRSNTSKTFRCPGILRDCDIVKAGRGAVKCDIFVRITTSTIGVTTS